MKHVIQGGRTRFGDIVAEFYMPKKASGRAVILCDGCPSVPSKRRLGEFLARKGFWVFHLRYRGTWESGGEFLKFAPNEDVLIVAEGLNKGFTEMWSEVTYVLDIADITVIGASFGGAAALLSSLDPRITRAVVLAPVTDFRYEKGGESLAEFFRQVKEGFAGAYRASTKNYTKLRTGKFYNPIVHAREFDPAKLFIVHAVDDKVIPVVSLRIFAKKAKLPKRSIRILRTGGHYSTNIVMQLDIWKSVARFLDLVK